jgi:APA family basic amino acid/polyamine antiporter
VIQTGSIASIAYVFSGYFEYFFPAPHLSPAWEAWGFSLKWGEQVILDLYPLKDIGLKMLTVFLIMFLSTVNFFGVALGVLQNVFTVLKNIAIAFIVVLALTMGAVQSPTSRHSLIQRSVSIGDMLGIVRAQRRFWAYDGWNNVLIFRVK